jgi:hypothetical protein
MITIGEDRGVKLFTWTTPGIRFDDAFALVTVCGGLAGVFVTSR